MNSSKDKETAADYPSPLLFFDGICVLCNSAVDRYIRWDKNKKLKYAPLEGQAAADLIGPAALEKKSMMLYEHGNIYEGIDAVMRTMALLFPFFGIVFKLIRIYPIRIISVPLYRLIARNRYRIFGKNEACRMPGPGEKELFID